ncbi:efflux RND transporter permease subunit [Kordiimonas aestuarii]|uniref:efflux RND transporter permease subunit n=1 Tax=Kordiimonas aestuarii TaxID=1005925 RepID=UPI0021CE2332|nr:MMPL family transporter [Kordiimonas aestuarii]
MKGWNTQLAAFMDRFRWLILIIGSVLSMCAWQASKQIKVSTKLEALMPEGAPSVRTLNDAMEKAGSFSAVQVIVEGDNRTKVEQTLLVLEAVTRPLAWSESVQSFEDISVLERHKLLQLSVPQLEQVEQKLEHESLKAAADSITATTGIPISITLRGAGEHVPSRATTTRAPDDQPSVDALLAPVETERRFVSDDGRSQALVIWPKAGNEGLAAAKKMIGDIAAIIQALELNSPDSDIHVGIAGRIRNKVAQFDAVIHDVVIGLGSSVTLIILLLLLHYRRLMAIPLIVLPLVVGILWTVGITVLVIGGLNLITIFLALILFGLGIDFGIHNFSRYAESRGEGLGHREALATILGHTGKASLVAGITTAAGFLVLGFTEFRAFREFGLIAGSGVVLIYVSMFSIFPAFLSVVHRHMSWPKVANAQKGRGWMRQLGSRKHAICVAVLVSVLLPAALPFASRLAFEKNFKNIQAARSTEHIWATERSKNIFKGGHDRAILVVDTLDEVKAIENYFESYTANDKDTPTVAKITSIRNFVPDPAEQAERLRVINRMWERVSDGGPLPNNLADKVKYLRIGTLDANDLPAGMKRVFLGDAQKPGYLMYIYNSVTMDDADLARQFYDDASSFTVNGKTYHPASEAFIFVEMLALMKADALRAIGLVSIVTLLAVLVFTRSVLSTVVILVPTAIGMVFTLAIMSIAGLPLSIINMVILPSLVGISVDNSIHIVERFQEDNQGIGQTMATTGRAATLTTLTTLMGFGGLVTASMGGLRSMGCLALIGFSICLLLTWFLLPALLPLTARKKAQSMPTNMKESILYD